MQELKVYIPNVLKQDRDDLFFTSNNSLRWEKLQENTQKLEIEEQQLQKSKKKLQQGYQFGLGLAAKASTNENKFSRAISYGVNSIKFAFQSKKIQQNFDFYFSDISQQQTLYMLSHEDSTVIKNGMKLQMDKIEYNQKIYINKNVVENINLKNIYESIQNDTIGKIQQSSIIYENIDNTNIFIKDKKKIQIRVLFNQNIKNDKEIIKNNGQVIIHIHGGGFISLSSRFHQTYTRKFANQLSTIVFSIDYGLAPEHAYPSGLDDCWQAYNWILKYCEQFFQITPKKVILVGDSAGGNLVMGITSLCIRLNSRIPDGLVLCYPALHLDLNRFTSSYLIAMNDFMLPFSFLKICCESYLKQKDQELFKMVLPCQDPFISPILLSDEILKMFPKVQILTGTADPLYDDQWRLLEKLKQNNVKCNLKQYVDFPHGFLNLDSIFNEAKICIDDTINFINDLFQ